MSTIKLKKIKIKKEIKTYKGKLPTLPRLSMRAKHFGKLTTGDW